MSSSQDQPRTLYVGNLDPGVTEELVMALFAQIGAIQGCKIIADGTNDPYAFVEFVNHADASAALTAMNQRMCLGRELRVNWASSSSMHAGAGSGGGGGGGHGHHHHHNSHHPRQDTSKHHHIFVGDLSPQIDTPELREAFTPFGEISDCRVVKDGATQKSRGYGFVSFVNKEDAENAIQMMNGSWLGSRAIRTSWAARKPPQANDGERGGGGGFHHHHHQQKTLNYDDVFQQSSSSNCTVYCGGLAPAATADEVLRQSFEEFGDIVDTRIFKDKGFAFIKFATKESACRAIVARHNSDIAGQTVKCSWGKEQDQMGGPPGGPHHAGSGGHPGYYDAYQQQMNAAAYGQAGGYWPGYGMDGSAYMAAAGGHPMAGDYHQQHGMYSPAAYGQYYPQQYPMMAMPQGGAAPGMPPYPPAQQYPTQ